MCCSAIACQLTVLVDQSASTACSSPDGRGFGPPTRVRCREDVALDLHGGWRRCWNSRTGSGFPALLGKTSPSTPGLAKASRWSARSPAVTGEMVIDRIEELVFGSLRSHSPVWSLTSCSVTRTLRLRTSRRARRSPTSSLHRIPESTAR